MLVKISVSNKSHWKALRTDMCNEFEESKHAGNINSYIDVEQVNCSCHCFVHTTDRPYKTSLPTP